MKRIFWFIQQCEEFGGTEMVSFQILSSLAKDYNITVVFTSKKTNECIYSIPDNVKRVYLGYNMDEIRMDYYMRKYKDQKKYFKMISLFFRAAFNIVFRRFSARRKIKKMTTEDDILIASSLDNYVNMPRGRKVFFHYHFNAKFFFSFTESFFRIFMRTPDKWIFLSESTLNEVVSKKKSYKAISTFVLNPIRFKPNLDLELHNNEFIFVGRFMQQKNPMFLLEAMKYLKEFGDKFKLHMFGDGPFEKNMVEYINDNDLDKYVFIQPSTINIGEEYKNKDLILVSSVYEGFCLVMIEANSQSVPVISTNWGDAVYERIENGKNGYIVESNKAEDFAKQIHEVISNKEKLIKMREQAYENSKKYYIDNISIFWKENILK